MGTGFVSLLTDYGLSDGFVGVMHGVILSHNPDLRIIDITHDVHPGDVVRGAAVLGQTVQFLPVGAHVAVVDPGVGTARRSIAIQTAHGFLVGPDNGLLWTATQSLGGIEAAVELTNTDWHLPDVSATFHGRDIFGPVAARLASGEPFADAGIRIDPESLVQLPTPEVYLGNGEIEAAVHTIDRFGNVQLFLDGAALSTLDDEIEVMGQSARRVRTFGDAQRGALVLFTDSAGHAAIAINGGRAVVALGVEPGDRVYIANRNRRA